MYLYSTVLYHDCALSHFPPLSSSTFYKFDFFIDLIDFYPFFFLSIFGFFQQTITYVTDTCLSLLSEMESNQMIVPFGKKTEW